ncbi:Protein CBG09419 [Caenorhabditis briggsae]|uniref:Protein CBG09419 n=1 Tax=Caenorhabditis briggsae TaxID=6238 RepID=A8X955_CAEBR|nr:Protein CBG09419 [Caenorhabditis briggsae]CAP29167.2 Protein CBG09419 [Caenorhabditis briggsae]
MPGDNKFYKYFVVYPFNVLSISKLTVIVLLILSLYGWDVKQKTSGSNFLLAIYDILAIGVAAISLWFIVQKFYWLKVVSYKKLGYCFHYIFYCRRTEESVFNIIGILLSLASISTSFVTTLDPVSMQSVKYYSMVIIYNSHFQMTHILTLSIWIFSAFWAWRETYNNVSNLFISEWGDGGEETEIEYLEQHF